MVGQPGAAGSRLELVSPWPPEQCRAAFVDAVDGSWTARGEQPVIGRASGTVLRARWRISYRNSFQTVLRAELVGFAGGTRIRCRFGLHPFVVAFMTFWLGAVTLAGATVAVALLSELLRGGPRRSREEWLVQAVPVGMAVFGWGLLRFGRFLARNERRHLLDFLRTVLHAVPAGPGRT